MSKKHTSEFDQQTKLLTIPALTNLEEFQQILLSKIPTATESAIKPKPEIKYLRANPSAQLLIALFV